MSYASILGIQTSSFMSHFGTSSRSRLLALLLAGFLGVFGIHRFYVGRFWTGLLQLATGGGFGVWWIIDTVLIAVGVFTDADGKPLKNW